MQTLRQSRCRAPARAGSHHVDELRQVDHDDPPLVHQQVVGRQVAVGKPAGRGAARCRRPGRTGAGRARLGRPASGPAGARRPPVADELHQQLGARPAPGTAREAECHSRQRASNSAAAHGLRATAAVRVRPAPWPARAAAAECAALEVVGVAVEDAVLGRGSAWPPAGGRRRAAGDAATKRKTSASLPVLRMPSSVSTAAAGEVITHGGHGLRAVGRP